MKKTMNQTFEPIIYCYIVENNDKYSGLRKIGYTTTDINKRLKAEFEQCNIKPVLLWKRIAKYNDGTPFTDLDFHKYLSECGDELFVRIGEWFKIDPQTALNKLEEFIAEQDSKIIPWEEKNYE